MTVLRALDRHLPQDSGRRTLALTGALLAAAAVVVLSTLPYPVPPVIWVRQLVLGCTNALLAVGIVLVWRSARVVNFAQAALGAFAAFFCGTVGYGYGVPFVLLLPLAVGLGALAGLIVNAVFVQRFFNAPRLVLTVVTIVVARFLGDSKQYVSALPVVGDRSKTREVDDAMASAALKPVFGKWDIEVLGFPFTSTAVVVIVVSAGVLAALAVWLRRSKLGIAVRGAAVNAERAQSLGVNVRSVSALVWGLSGAFAGLALMLRGLVEGFRYGGEGADVPETYLIPALAAAVLAAMTHLPTAVLSGIAITVLSGAMRFAHPETPVVELALFFTIAVALLLQRRRGGRTDDSDASSWAASKEIRPVPPELSSLREVRRTKRLLIGAVVVLASIVPFALSSARVNLLSLILVQGIVALSIIVLTGWSGTISLGQFALVGAGAVLGSHLTSARGISFWIALPTVAAVIGAVAVALGIPALRIRGAFLAVTTLAFALAAERSLFGGGFLSDLIPPDVNRPSLFFISFSSERGYYFLCLVMLLAAMLVVRRLRHSRTGRVLIAARENAAGVEAFGVSLLRIRLAAFAVSGALAGAAGVLFVHHQRSVDAEVYGASVSVDMFIMTMVGGIGSVAGAVLGAAYIGIVTFMIRQDVVRNIATSGGLLVLLLVAPGGLAGLLAQMRDGVLRIIAMRQGIAAPSLFADSDLDAIVNKRVPLVQRIPFRGLEVIPDNRRYTRPSELHGGGSVLQEAPT